MSPAVAYGQQARLRQLKEENVSLLREGKEVQGRLQQVEEDLLGL